MIKVLTIDDGTQSRANKTDLYGKVVKSAQPDAMVDNKKLQDLKETDLQGFDLILTDLDGTSKEDNNKFLDLLLDACQAGYRPVVKMFSARFNGKTDDLPASIIPEELQGIVATHGMIGVLNVIRSALSELGGSQAKGIAR